MRFAVIDLGTNTFHLLIAEHNADGSWTPVLHKKEYIKLAEEGIQRIGDAPFARGIAAVKKFRTMLDEAGVAANTIKAFGTAALRTAENAPDFLQQMFDLTGIQPESIPGDREAELIYKGVRQAVPFPNNRVLIMDIGGGSVEFIIADGEKVLWQKSFPIGVAVLYRRYHVKDPMTPVEVWQLENYLEMALEELWDALKLHSSPTLIGASGTFDVIDNFILDPETKPDLYGYILLDQFEPLYQMLRSSTLDQRRAMEKLPDERVEMVVVAVVLIRYVLRRAGIREIYTSAYAMKEGILSEMLIAD